MNINLLDDTDAFYISVVFILKKKTGWGFKIMYDYDDVYYMYSSFWNVVFFCHHRMMCLDLLTNKYESLLFFKVTVVFCLVFKRWGFTYVFKVIIPPECWDTVVQLGKWFDTTPLHELCNTIKMYDTFIKTDFVILLKR